MHTQRKVLIIKQRSPWRTGGDTGMPPCYVDEDYPAGPGITEPLPE